MLYIPFLNSEHSNESRDQDFAMPRSRVGPQLSLQVIERNSNSLAGQIFFKELYEHTLESPWPKIAAQIRCIE